MTWQTLNSSALAKFCDGDIESACADWSQAVALSDTPSARKNADVAEMHFNFGRCLISLKRYEEAVPVFRKAKSLFESINVQHDRIMMIDTALRDALKYIGEVDEVKALNRKLVPEFHEAKDREIPLKESLKVLRAAGFASELKGAVLKRLCRKLEIFPEEFSEELTTLLFHYYTEDETGGLAAEDGMIIIPYVDFNPKDLCQYLNYAYGYENLLNTGINLSD